MTTTTAEAKARAIIKTKTTRFLIDSFVCTGWCDDPDAPIVRGWIMDELQIRNPEAFEAWLDGDDWMHDESLYKYFAC